MTLAILAGATNLTLVGADYSNNSGVAWMYWKGEME